MFQFSLFLTFSACSFFLSRFMGNDGKGKSLMLKLRMISYSVFLSQKLIYTVYGLQCCKVPRSHYCLLRAWSTTCLSFSGDIRVEGGGLRPNLSGIGLTGADTAPFPPGVIKARLLPVDVLAVFTAPKLSVEVDRGQYLRVWALSPWAPQLGHLYSRSTGHETFPRSSFRLWLE